MNSQNDEINTFWLRGHKTNFGKGHPITLVAYLCNDQNNIKFSTITHCPPDKFDRKYAHKELLEKLSKDGEFFNIQLNEEIGPEATIARHIVAEFYCNRIKQVPIPRKVQAAQATYETLVNRYITRKLRKLNNEHKK